MAFRLAFRFGVTAAMLALMALLPPAPGVAAPRHAAASPAAPAPLNRVHDRLLQLSPRERAATLARAIGHWCIGTEAFPMGLVTSGAGEGNAYWSLRCADGTSWAVQIDPLAEVTAIDCETFKVRGAGKECFKKF